MRRATDMNPLLTFDESASLLGITRISLERWIRSKRISPPMQEFARGARFYSLSDLDAWLAERPQAAKRAAAKLSPEARATLIEAATKRTAAEREARKVERAREARKASRQEAKTARQRAPVPAEPATADAEQVDVAPVDDLTRWAHAPRTPRHARFVRNRQMPQATNDPHVNSSIDSKLGIGRCARLNWRL